MIDLFNAVECESEFIVQFTTEVFNIFFTTLETSTNHKLLKNETINPDGKWENDIHKLNNELRTNFLNDLAPDSLEDKKDVYLKIVEDHHSSLVALKSS